MKYFLACLCVAAGGLSLFFLAKVGLEIRQYMAWDQTVQALHTDLKIEEKSQDQFVVKIFYTFPLEGKYFWGSTVLAKPYFFNAETAAQAVKILSKQDWMVFFSKKNPQNSTVQKTFPYLHIIHATLSVGVFVYFFLLGVLIKRGARLVSFLAKETSAL